MPNFLPRQYGRQIEQSLFSIGEKALKNLAADKVGNRSGQWTVDEIKSIVTVKNLCSCSDPISTAFKVE